MIKRMILAVVSVAGLAAVGSTAFAQEYDDGGGSDAAIDAVDRWDVGAIQGNWMYENDSGDQIVAPYTTDSYTQDNGYYYEGSTQGGDNYDLGGSDWSAE